MISSGESCFSKDAIIVPFLPSRIVSSMWASVAVFCHAASLKLRTPCFAKTGEGSPSLPWQGEQLRANTAAGSAARAGTARPPSARAAATAKRGEGMMVILRMAPF